MAVKINYLKQKIEKPSSNIVLFTNEKFNVSELNKFIPGPELSYINDLLKVKDTKKKIFVYEVSSKKKIILVSIKNNSKTSDIESLGAEFYEQVNHGKDSEYYLNSDSIIKKQDNFLGFFLHGIKLKSTSLINIKQKKKLELLLKHYRK